MDCLAKFTLTTDQIKCVDISTKQKTLIKLNNKEELYQEKEEEKYVVLN